MSIGSLVLGSICLLGCSSAFHLSNSNFSFLHNAKKPTIVQDAIVAELKPFSWQGFYAGVEIGRHDAHMVPQKLVQQKDDSLTEEKNVPLIQALSGGIFAGYNITLNKNIVAGVTGNLSLSNLKYNTFEDHSKFWLQEAYFGDLNGRLGYSFGRFMPYLTGGLSFSSLKLAWATNDTSSPVFQDVFDSINPRFNFTEGYNLGAGFDYALNEKLILRTEYRYNCLKNPPMVSYTGINEVIDSKEQNIPGKLIINNIRVGLACKF